MNRRSLKGIELNCGILWSSSMSADDGITKQLTRAYTQILYEDGDERP